MIMMIAQPAFVGSTQQPRYKQATDRTDGWMNEYNSVTLYDRPIKKTRASGFLGTPQQNNQ